MNFLNNVKIGTRLIALTIITSALLLAVGLVGVWGIHQSSRALTEMYDRHLTSINNLQSVRVKQFQIRNDIFDARLAQDSFVALEKFDEIDKRIRQITELLDAYQKQPLSAEEKQLLDAYQVVRMAGENRKTAESSASTAATLAGLSTRLTAAASRFQLG